MQSPCEAPCSFECHKPSTCSMIPPAPKKEKDLEKGDGADVSSVVFRSHEKELHKAQVFIESTCF